MTDDKNTFYVTTPIYYVSGKPHLGHAYTTIAADTIARWNRNLGKEVFFLTGTDEHGQKVAKKAKEANKSPKQFVDELIPEFESQIKKLNISNDYFIRTTFQEHKKFVQDMLQKAYDNGDIYKDTYEGLYCIDCEQYYKEDDLEENNTCPIHKKPVEKMKEENYFFRLSKYENQLLKFYEENPEFLSPKSKAQETINRVKEGLQDISISRHKNTLDWGVEFPFDKDHVTYVWFDALFNYVSALEINNKQKFWPADFHIVGKDIMWFHKVYWPAFLISTGYKLPKRVFAHGWWTVDGNKMGKALGNVIEPLEIAKEYGVDELRYFMLSVGTFGDDLDFSMEKFAEKINNELNNDLGNLISRVHAMTNKYFKGKVPKSNELTEDEIELTETLNIFKKFNNHMQNLEFNHALETLFHTIRETNAYINKVSPWKEQDIKRLETIINILIFTVKTISQYIDCFMPETTQRIRKQFNFEKETFEKFENVKAGHQLGEKDNLFQKIKIEKKEEKPEEKKKEGFEILNLKVGKIINAKKHPEAEKLIIEQIDLGEEKPRQIVSGIANTYTPEELIGRIVIVVANLKPSKLRGEISEGMILVSENEETKEIGLLSTNAEIGTNLSCNKKIANNEQRIKPDHFFKIEMTSDGKKIYFNKQEITANNKDITVDKNITGIVC